MKYQNLLVAAAFSCTIAMTASAEPILFESFESGDMSTPDTNAFSWGSNNKTSVVTSEAAVYNNRTIYNIPSGAPDWSPLHGDHSLRFRYPAGGVMAEQRFTLDKPYKELWFQYWVRVPTNFYHGQNSPNNHKFFAIWMDGYSHKGDGATLIWEMWGDASGSNDIAFHHSSGDYTGTGGFDGHKDFITVPEDRGRWMEITIHVKSSSVGSADDGVIELWRRWAGDPTEERELFHSAVNKSLPLPSEGPQGWKAGYFMGWANGSYAEETEWLIDHIVVSEEPLIDTEGLAPNNAAAPEPPVLKLKQ